MFMNCVNWYKKFLVQKIRILLCQILILKYQVFKQKQIPMKYHNILNWGIICHMEANVSMVAKDMSS